MQGIRRIVEKEIGNVVVKKKERISFGFKIAVKQGRNLIKNWAEKRRKGVTEIINEVRHLK